MGLKNYFAPSKAARKSTDNAPRGHELAKLAGSSKGLLYIAGEPAVTPLNISRVGSPAVSRPGSLFEGSGGFDPSNQDIVDLKCDVMVNHLYKKQQERIWSTPNAEDEGVVLKKSRGRYTCCPATLADGPNGFVKAIEALNVRVSNSFSVSDPSLLSLY